MVGSSGISEKRLAPLAASPRALPDWITGTIEPAPNMAEISPAINAMPAGPPPRYGTCVRSMLTCCLSTSIAR